MVCAGSRHHLVRSVQYTRTFWGTYCSILLSTSAANKLHKAFAHILKHSLYYMYLDCAHLKLIQDWKFIFHIHLDRVLVQARCILPSIFPVIALHYPGLKCLNYSWRMYFLWIYESKIILSFTSVQNVTITQVPLDCQFREQICHRSVCLVCFSLTVLLTMYNLNRQHLLEDAAETLQLTLFTLKLWKTHWRDAKHTRMLENALEQCKNFTKQDKI